MAKIEYIPRFTVSGKSMRLIMEIAAALERYKIVMEGPNGVRLRKLNHIRTIRGTTAIEGNALTEDQITAVLAGKRVVATRREIDEVKGAHRAYEKIEMFNPYSVKILRTLKAKGEAYEVGKESGDKSRVRSRDKNEDRDSKWQPSGEWKYRRNGRGVFEMINEIWTV